MDKIKEAAEFAERMHEGQFRKWSNSDTPYIIHPSRVASMVSKVSGVTDEMVTAAWLHDVVEDTVATVGHVKELFGDKVASLVKELTTPPTNPALCRTERKTMDRKYLKDISKEAKIIKLCDRIDNLTDLFSNDTAPKNFKNKYREESILLLQECLTGVDDKLENEFKKLIECNSKH